jgi:uncharacterized protein
MSNYRETKPWIQTYIGRRFYVLDPKPEDIYIEDIAHSLSMLCRFNGHTKAFYSVGDHSIRVSHLCKAFPLWGLLHDASEAYIADVCRPLKKSGTIEGYIAAEHRIMQAVCQRFGLSATEPPEVKEADLVMLVTEARDLMGTLDPGWRFSEANGYKSSEEKIVPLSPFDAEMAFLQRFQDLGGRHF